ncbi:MAG TPA: DEAD/DEAH box helicase [Pyrinomonadaceae bacterium]|jgi:ATP-dependent RNA helicase DeaD
MTLETGDVKTFKEFGLIDELMKAIDDVGYETPSPIQLKTIPVLLEGRDIVGQAQTGTGKTAAFALPGLQKIDTSTSRIQLLVLTPTRELAIQVAEAFHTYAKHLGRVRVLPVYGGQSITQQIKHLRQGVQVIVGTPGRVMDHMRRETIDLTTLKMVVLDEADEMLRMGFEEDVEWILSHTPETRQTALFSATMPRQVRRIAEKYLNDPVNIETERKTMTVVNTKQFYVNVSEGQKIDALTRILEADSSPGEAVLIFHRTKIGADQLTEKLQARGYAAEAMHGDMSQNQREAVIKRLKNGQLEIVVATDVAARGLDVEQITSVINYDMPGDTEVYVHRIGRTGRAGREGKAILFVTPRQQRMKRDIENYTKQHIEPFRMPTQADVASRRVAILKERILDTLTKQDLELYLSLVEELAEECGCDIAEIAAAATFLAVGDKPLQVKVQPKAEQLVKQWNTDMTRLFVDVGRSHGVSAGDIVGAIANEGNVPGKAIGAIDIYDRFTLVDVPSEFTEQVLEQMRNSRIRSQKANLRVADSSDAAKNTRQSFEKSPESFARERDSFEKPRKTFEKSRDDYADKSGGDKPPRRKKTDSRENSFRQYEKPGTKKKTNARPKSEAKTARPKKLKDGKKKPKWTKEQRAERGKFPKSK